MSENNPFPPSTNKLAKLREAGIFPYSTYLADTTLLFGCVLGAIVVIVYYGSAFSDWATNIFSLSSDTPPYQNGLSYITTLERKTDLSWFGVLIIPLLITAVMSLVVGLFQTKMYLGPTFFATNHVGKAKSFSTKLAFVSFLYLVFFIVCCSVAFFSAWKKSWNSFPFSTIATIQESLPVNAQTTPTNGLQLSSTPPSFQLENLKMINLKSLDLYTATFQNYCITILFMLIIIGIISRIVALLFFKTEHMMSREEIEAEIREDSVPEEAKQAREHFFES